MIIKSQSKVKSLNEIFLKQKRIKMYLLDYHESYLIIDRKISKNKYYISLLIFECIELN